MALYSCENGTQWDDEQYTDCPCCRGGELLSPCVDPKDERIAALEEQLRVVREALGEAGVILEVLRGQIVRRPYAEMTGEFQDSIIEASEKVRDAIRKPVQEHQK